MFAVSPPQQLFLWSDPSWRFVCYGLATLAILWTVGVLSSSGRRRPSADWGEVRSLRLQLATIDDELWELRRLIFIGQSRVAERTRAARLKLARAKVAARLDALVHELVKERAA